MECQLLEGNFFYPASGGIQLDPVGNGMEDTALLMFSASCLKGATRLLCILFTLFDILTVQCSFWDCTNRRFLAFIHNDPSCMCPLKCLHHNFSGSKLSFKTSMTVRRSCSAVWNFNKKVKRCWVHIGPWFA